jgi:hypothetical protein
MVLPGKNWVTRLASPLLAFGPYAAIGLVVPGGSLIALSLWVVRHRARLASQIRRALGMAAVPAASSRADAPRLLAVADRRSPVSGECLHGFELP